MDVIAHDLAVCDALKDNRLGGAALDVFETEPVPADNIFRDNAHFLAV